MIRLLRALGGAALWAAAALGALTCAVWLATAADWIKPLIVVSGSMEPEIPTGALIIDRPLDSAEVVVGDVVSLPSTVTGNVVTHRVVDVARHGDAIALTLRGDANPIDDPEPYLVDGDLWEVAVVIPGLGEAIADVSRPGVVIPAMIAIGALLGLSLLRGPAPDRGGPEVPRGRGASADSGGTP
ncbi:signal peptidase I [Demequina sp. NBRC 110055]|uniref:signal peptidase I n=1 Tax=Demequina sp. NBRC 110055 TaxID=1570344 RepID=UPI000A0450BE|nr:signal peptidase I [Demequina sp. NBRC 110055]